MQEDFDAQLGDVALRMEGLGRRQQATVFLVMARSLSPLLNGMRWDREASSTIEKVMNVAEEAVIGGRTIDVAAFREQLIELAPHVDDVPAPVSTYIQDILICLDGALCAVSAHLNVKGVWIEYALEPLISSLCERDWGVLDIGDSPSELAWRSGLASDPVMVRALAFIDRCISVSEGGGVPREEEMNQLQYQGKVLIPMDWHN